MSFVNIFVISFKRLRDWKKVLHLMKGMESSIPSFSQGFVNQLLLFLGRSGKIDAMMKVLGSAPKPIAAILKLCILLQNCYSDQYYASLWEIIESLTKSLLTYYLFSHIF